MNFRTRARLRLLQMHFESKVGHIGGNLSALDLLLSLHHSHLTDADQFILSKGHAAGALYVTLWTRGLLTDEELQSFHGDGTLLAGHPPASGIPGTAFGTGSLGHGLGLAAGVALGKRLQGQPGRAYCLTSDGEWNEGSSWESLIFIAHHQLDVTILVDLNGLQGFGSTREVADLSPLAEKFAAFGIATMEIDGHDPRAIRQALQSGSGPRAIVARTQKGKGVSFMQDRMEWHYLPMTPEQYGQARSEVERECATSSVEHS